MKRIVPVLTLCVAALGWGSGFAAGDTKGPSTQTLVLECGGATVTVVSPVESARAAQVVGSTGVGVLQQVTLSDGTVLFEQPSFEAHDPASLTTCTVAVPGDTLTLKVFMTPQGKRTR